MNADRHLKSAAEFLAYLYAGQQDQNADCWTFARDNWVAFLPLATVQLGRALNSRDRTVKQMTLILDTMEGYSEDPAPLRRIAALLA